MKLKQQPEDFQVEEVLARQPGREGRWFIHRLRKRKMDTLHALAIVAREANVRVAEIGCAGLKDRQGVTVQYISIPGRKVAIRSRDLEVRQVGRSPEPLTADWSQGNRFTITLRALDPEELERLERQAPLVARWGVPNYFGDQRFGCVRHNQGFIIRPLLAGRPGQALKSLLAAVSPYDRPGAKSIKEALAKAWGDWDTCAKIGRKLGYDKLFKHLSRQPGDLFGAFKSVPKSLRLIHLYAFQSYLWNRAVSGFMARRFHGDRRLQLPSEIGRLAAYRELEGGEEEALLRLELPLPAGDLDLPEGGGAGAPADLADSLHRTLRWEGLRMEELRLPRAVGMNFKAQPRPLVVVPGEFELSPPEPDRVNQGGLQVRARFVLPRGCYATVVVKRLTWRAFSGRREGEAAEE